jgi:Methylamine utilisation protein MauE
MRRPSIITIISSLLILLFVYAAFSKLEHYSLFKNQLHAQPLPSWLDGILVWLLPFLELVTVVMLMIPASRFAGLILSLLLMLAFTAYVGLALLHYFGKIPCSCGGILEHMSWSVHFWFNVFFMLLAGWGCYLQWTEYRLKRSVGQTYLRVKQDDAEHL